MKKISYLQRIGQSLIAPISILPTAAILIGIGYWIDPISFGKENILANFLIKSGSVIIENMSLLFSIGISYGLSKDKHGSAALAGFVGFTVLTALCEPSFISTIKKIPIEQVPIAFKQIKNNQFIGIMSGVISSIIYNNFRNIEFNNSFSFFSGRRLVPILVSLIMILISLIIICIWPLLFNWLTVFGKYIQKMNSLGAGIYAFLNRLLIPIGLHHALNSIFWFDCIGINDIPNFLGGSKSIESNTGIIGITGRYQAGFFPIMMFGLPGAALAIYKCSHKKNKNKVAGIMLSSSFSSFFTGITEPLEFSFIFLSPFLYFLHSLLTGLSVYISSSMQWISGFGFSAGFIDLFLSIKNPLAINWYMLIPQGIVFFLIYYLLFYFFINTFNLSTFGRKKEKKENYNINKIVSNGIKKNKEKDSLKLAFKYISIFGGLDNLVNVESCITRIRLLVIDNSLIDEEKVKNIGAKGIIKIGKNNIHIIIGTQAEYIADNIRKILEKKLN